MDDGVGFFRHGFQHGRDKIRIRGQGDVFLRACLNRLDRSFAVVAYAAGNHRNINSFALQAGDQGGDIHPRVDHDNVRALPRPQCL